MESIKFSLPLYLVGRAINLAPQWRFHSDEEYFPSTVEDYLAKCELRIYGDHQSRETQIASPVTMDHLANFHRDWGESATGYLKIRDDSVRSGNLATAKVYVNILQRASDQFDLQYWLFYPFNGWVSAHAPIGPNIELANLGEHEGDWEHVTVRVTAHPDGPGDGTIHAVHFAAHGDLGEWRFPKESNKGSTFSVTDDGRPIVWVALHSHASYWDSEDHNYKNIAGINLVDRPNNDGIHWDTARMDRPDVSNHFLFVGHHGQDLQSPPPLPAWVNFDGRWGDMHRKNSLRADKRAELLAVGIVGGLAAGEIIDFLEGHESGPTGPAIPDADNYSPWFNGDNGL